ncbi:MAG: competence/damage-inducible protein A [Verrucomicrobiales bacterium]
MRIEVVNIGTELLLGKVTNTHAAYFGEQLFKLGLRIQRQTAIPDGDEIRVALEESFPRSDVVLVTGGLGPTADDVTREVVAAMLGRELRLDAAIRDEIREMFRKRRLKASSSNDRQAMVPEGAEVLANPRGTAPGLYLASDPEAGFPHLFLLPGPPRELRPMFETAVGPRLAGLRGEALLSNAWRNFRIYGIGESSLASKLEPRLSRIPNLELGYCARLGEVDLRLIGSPEAVDAASEILRAEYGSHIAAESEDSIAKVVLDLLVERRETVATAESCTGGLIASTLTDEPGSSAILGSAYVTYSNEAKTKILGVPPEMLAEHGAVSDPVARAMAEGCLRASGADHAIAVSGIAGPGGGSDAKPVGTVHIALAGRSEPTFSRRYLQPSDRTSFKLRVTRLALDLLRRRLRGFSLDY